MKNVSPGTREGTFSVLLLVSIIGTMFTFPQPVGAVPLMYSTPEAGVEVAEILFFSYRIKHLRFGNSDVYSHLVLKIKASVFCI